jgi:hypothetical protein
VLLAKHVEHQPAKAIDDCRVIGERRRRLNQTESFHKPGDSVERPAMLP